jgi:LEA14-like dessication related protein
MRRAMVVAAGALAVTVAGGCASLGRQMFEEPVVTFKNVQLNGLGLQGGNLDVVLNVYNPNGYKLEATRLTYNLMLGDNTPVGTGAIDERFQVQKGDSTTVRLPVAFTFAGLGAAGRQLLQSGSVNYRVTGDVTVNTPLGNFTRPYSGRGTFSTLSGAERTQ